MMLLCLLELIQVAKGHLDELQKADIVSKRVSWYLQTSLKHSTE